MTGNPQAGGIPLSPDGRWHYYVGVSTGQGFGGMVLATLEPVTAMSPSLADAVRPTLPCGVDPRSVSVVSCSLLAAPMAPLPPDFGRVTPAVERGAWELARYTTAVPGGDLRRASAAMLRALVDDSATVNRAVSAAVDVVDVDEVLIKVAVLAALDSLADQVVEP